MSPLHRLVLPSTAFALLLGVADYRLMNPQKVQLLPREHSRWWRRRFVFSTLTIFPPRVLAEHPSDPGLLRDYTPHPVFTSEP